MKGKSEKQFVDDVVKRLRQADETLDADVRRRLRQARETALEPLSDSDTRSRRNWWLPGLAMASVLALVVTVLVSQTSTVMPGSGPDVLEIVASSDSLELYRDIEFYQWLAEQQASAG